MDELTNTFPETIIFEALKNLLDYCRSDYTKSKDKEQSFLYLVLKENKIQNYEFFKQAVSVFIDPESSNEPRFVDINMGYNTDRIGKHHPTIHLILQGDQPQDDSLGSGEGNIDPEYDNQNGEITEYFEKRYRQSINLMITSDNSNEKILIYYVLKALLVSSTRYFDAAGIQNLKMRGSDVTLNTQVTGNLTMRCLTLIYDYDFSSPDLSKKQSIGEIFYKLIIDKQKTNNA